MSTADQQTIPEQVRQLEELAKRRGWKIVRTVREVASGAAKRAKRDELLDAARRREFDAILVWKLDRWGRSVADLVATINELTSLGVAFVSFTEALDLSTPSGRALAGMLAARKRDWVEAPRAYQLALKAFSDVGNQVEHAKTALKYGTMVLAKGTETDKPDRHEVEAAIQTLGRALLVLRARSLNAEVEDGERVLYALQRLGMRLRN